MGYLDIHSDLFVQRAISPILATDDTPLVSQIIDMQGFDFCEFLIATGVIDDANATFAILVQEDDNVGFSSPSAVADEDLFGTEAGAAFNFADDNEVRKIGYRGNQRFVRLTITPSGNSANPAGALIAAIAVKSTAHQQPVGETDGAQGGAGS